MGLWSFLWVKVWVIVWAVCFELWVIMWVIVWAVCTAFFCSPKTQARYRLYTKILRTIVCQRGHPFATLCGSTNLVRTAPRHPANASRNAKKFRVPFTVP